MTTARPPVSPEAALKALERDYDQQVGKLSVLALPQRPLLVGVHHFVTSIFLGGAGPKSIPNSEKAVAIINRLSYVVPLLLRGPEEPTGLNAADAFLPFTEDPSLIVELLAVAQYGHFCELMPEVHRGYYEVSGSIEEGFVLKHPSPAFSESEERDILLAEIATPFFREPEFDRTARFVKIAKALIAGGLKQHFPALIVLAEEYYEHFLKSAFEIPLLSDAGFRAALGVSRNQFERFRAAWVAWAEVAREMGKALLLIGRPEPRKARRRFDQELLEWISVGFKTTFIEEMSMRLSGLSAADFDACMKIFLVGGISGTDKNYGEGYLPPLRRLQGMTIFCPDVLRIMMSSRNIPYALNRVDRRRFDNMVSQDLEPQLIRDAVAVLAQDSKLIIRPNCNWGGGEFDLLVFNPDENAALHVQAKAAIPPQGARMVQSIEGRTLEALEQLKCFRELADTEKNSILSASLGTGVAGVKVVDVMLSRSCFGSHRVWQSIGGVIACNLPILSGAIRRQVAKKGRVSLAALGGEIEALYQELRSNISRGWRHETVDFGITRITLPLLDLDVDAMGRARGALFPRNAT